MRAHHFIYEKKIIQTRSNEIESFKLREVRFPNNIFITCSNPKKMLIIILNGGCIAKLILRSNTRCLY